MPAKKMILNIENHTPYPAYISLLGGLQDPNQYNINAQTEYLYDIGNYNWATSSIWTLQFKRVGASTFSVQQGPTNGSSQAFLINTLRVSSTIFLLYTFNDYYEFGTLTIN
jgi:hypothetical protein